MATNRAALAAVPRWLPPKDGAIGGLSVAGNINYGVQPKTEAVLDLPVPFAVSYSDLLAWLLLCIGPEAGGYRYLEIGVSVGKNLHQVAAVLQAFGARPGRARLVGLDLEPFNPRLRDLYPPGRTLAAWPTPATTDGGATQLPPVGDAAAESAAAPASLKRDAQSSVAQHAWDGGFLGYVSADLKTVAAWEALSLLSTALDRDEREGRRGQPGGEKGGESGGQGGDTGADTAALASGGFDLIFSDAWHSFGAVTWELEQLLSRRLLSPRSVLVWDDLNSRDMQSAFGTMCIALRRRHPAALLPVAAGHNATTGEGQAEGVEDGGRRDRIDCWLSAVAPGWVASEESDLIGVAGPSRLLRRARLRDVLPSRLTLRDFGFALADDPPGAG